MGTVTIDKRMNPYFVMAKMDEGDAPFDRVDSNTGFRQLLAKALGERYDASLRD